MTKAIVAALFAVAVGSASGASAYTVYDVLGGAENGGDPIAVAGPVLADRFVTGQSATLTSVDLNLTLSGAPTAGFTVDLFADGGAAGPGAATVIATVQDTALNGAEFQVLDVVPVSPITLAANSSYYIGVADDGGSSAILGNTLDPSVLARTSVVAGGSYFNNGGVQANAGGPYEIAVNVAGVPEPATWAMMLAGLGGLGGMARLRRYRLAA